MPARPLTCLSIKAGEDIHSFVHSPALALQPLFWCTPGTDEQALIEKKWPHRKIKIYCCTTQIFKQLVVFSHAFGYRKHNKKIAPRCIPTGYVAQKTDMYKLVLAFIAAVIASSTAYNQVLKIRVNPQQAFGGPASEYFDTIEYIPLETTKESLFGYPGQLILTESTIVVADPDTRCILFFNLKDGRRLLS